MNTTVQLYEQKLSESIELRATLEKEFDYISRIYQTLKTDKATPDIQLLDFMKESIPDWTKILSSDLVIDIIRYTAAPSEEEKNKLTDKLLEKKRYIIRQKREIDLTLNDCPFEIDENISKCDIKIEELQNQVKAITRRIGIIEAEKYEWFMLKKKL